MLRRCLWRYKKRNLFFVSHSLSSQTVMNQMVRFHSASTSSTVPCLKDERSVFIEYKQDYVDFSKTTSYDSILDDEAKAISAQAPN